ncbi:MAG: tetratricopeptide repeat protein [Solobacterium sp.]|nr:tetratricopeptide repeat protein [Solobacterium sp.]
MRRRIENSFKGRLDEIRIFHERTNYLANYMHEDALVTNYYGIGGIGKTWLLKRLEYEAKNRGSKYVLYAFDGSTGNPADKLIRSIATSIDKVFGGHIWDRTIDLLDKYNADGSSLEKDFKQAEKLYKAVGDLADTGVKAASSSFPDHELVNTVKDVNDNYQTGRSLRENGITLAGNLDKPDSKDFAYSNEESRLKELADAFCADMKVLLEEVKKPLVIALDSIDRFYENNADDSWLKQIIMDLNDIHWLICGKDSLNWKEEEWKEEAEKGMPHLLTIQLQNLSEEDAKQYFAEEIEASDPELLDYLYTLTYGHPFYMYLCVDLWVALISKGEKADRQLFQKEAGNDKKNRIHTKLIDRFLGNDKDKALELASLYQWNESLLMNEKLSVSTEARDWFSAASHSSLFEQDPSGNYRFKDVIQSVLVTDALNKKYPGFLIILRNNIAYFMNDMIPDKNHQEEMHTAIEVLLYYLSLNRKEWQTDDVNDHSIVRCLIDCCHQPGNNGDVQDETDLSQRLLSCMQADDRFNSQEMVTVYSSAAKAHARKNDFSSAMTAYQKALEIADEHSDIAHDVLIELYHSLSNLHYQMGEYRDAVNDCWQALHIAEKDAGNFTLAEDAGRRLLERMHAAVSHGHHLDEFDEELIEWYKSNHSETAQTK